MAEFGMHIIITGNPVDGFEFYGPFATAEEAVEHGNTDGNIDAEWWTAPLQAVLEESGAEEVNNGR